jgi:hypothetical protein
MEYQHYLSQMKAGPALYALARFKYVNMTTWKPYIYNGLGTGYVVYEKENQTPRRMLWNPNPQGKQYKSDPTELRNLQALLTSRSQQQRTLLAKIQSQLNS